MPLSEFHRAARKKLHSTQSEMTTYTSDVSSSVPDDEFVELLWENGQIVMQGQSSKPKTSSHSKVEDEDHRDPAIQKLSHFEKFDSVVSETSPAVPCSDIGSYAQGVDDMAPWITNPMEDPFSSEFFSEFVGINPNPPLIERNNGHSSKALRDGSGLGKIGGDRCESSVVNNAISSMSGFGADDDHFQKQDSVSASKPSGASNGVGAMNFANFSRPASLARANSESLRRLKTNEKASLASASTNPTESTLVQASGARANLALDLQSKVNNHNNASLVANNRSISSDHRINHQSSRFAASIPVAEKRPEGAVASSTCSGNSAGAASSDQEKRAKRKDREGEEFGYHSEDLDDDGSKKPVTGRGGSSAKRARAAEVHNLSERRRRDRINEKMRALQELIPNCNKVDKASMLDEAIEYLKTLQLQVQMMSMGNGLCAPPMMLPSGMQHIGAYPMAHFSPMGAGMGMGMGLSYGMGVLDMNGSPNFPVIPVPSMHTAQFSYSSIPGTSGFQMPGSVGVQLFGTPAHGQGILPMQESNKEATMNQLRTSRGN